MRSPARPLTRGERNIAWIERHCVVPQGALVGQPVRLLPFQKEIILAIYDNPAGTRWALWSGAKKNGKTGLAAFLLLLHTVGPEARKNSQIVSTATSRDQAGILYEYATQTALQSPTLARFVLPRDSKKELFCPGTGVKYNALSADATKAHGRGAVFALHDEAGLTIGPNSELITAVGNAMGIHTDPLELYFSTQAPNDGDFLSIHLDDALSGRDPRKIGIL